MTTVKSVFSMPLLVLIGCAGKSENVIEVCASGGASAASNAGGNASMGGNAGNTGGTSSAGCQGLPVTAPPYVSPPAEMHCLSNYPSDMILIAGLQFYILADGDLTCSFPVPSPVPLNVTGTGSDYTDPNNVSLVFANSTALPETIPNVLTAADCTNANGGWYWDNNSNPTTITLCACSCDRVTQQTAIDASSSLYVLGFPKVCIVL
jgi:hypothetical protein